MNMVMVHDKEKNMVLVLDKVKKHGWEGLTFPGGHLEEGESLYDSAIREVWEETGLEVANLELRGLVHWDQGSIKDLGFLYYTSDFSGQLLDDPPEGRLYWQDLDGFLQADGKSDSMDDIMKIYLNPNLCETMATVADGDLDFRCF